MKYNFKDNYARAIDQLYSDVRLKEEKDRAVRQRCYEYLNNWVDGEHGQWTSDLRQQLGADKPALSFNEIRRLVNRVRGSIPELDEKCYPVDDEGDWILAEIFTDLLKHARNVNDAEILFKQAFSDAYIGSQGYVRVGWSNAKDIFGEVEYTYVDPRLVYLVGTGVRLDLYDRAGILELIPMDMDEIKSRWPDKANLLDDLKPRDKEMGTASNLDYALPTVEDWTTVYDEDIEKFLVKKLQRFEWVDATIIRAGGKTVPTKLKGGELDAALEMMKSQGLEPQKTTLKRKRVHCYYAIGGIELEEHESPYEHGMFDLVPMIAYMDGGRITGIVQDLLDPQDEKNKRRSQMINILNTSAAGSYLYKSGSIADPEKATKQLGKPRQLIEVQGNLNESVTPVRTDLTVIPSLVEMEMQSVQDMKDISGLHDAALGQVPAGVKSGRGIQQLQLPTETLINELIAHYVFFRKQVARLTISIIQQYYTEERRIRVLGDYHAKYQPEDQQVQTMMQQGLIRYEDGAKLLTVNRQMLEGKLNDVSVGRYDVVIDTTSGNPTMRRAQFFDILNAKSQGAPIKWSTAMKYSDIRGKAEVVRDIQEAESFMAGVGGAPPQLSPGPQNATPPTAHDLLGNVAGGQH